MEHTENAITLRGQLTGLPEFSHENHGKRFCRFLLEVRRLSLSLIHISEPTRP